jgi:hypothetical protein
MSLLGLQEERISTILSIHDNLYNDGPQLQFKSIPEGKGYLLSFTGVAYLFWACKRKGYLLSFRSMTTSTMTLTAGDIALYIMRAGEPHDAAIARFRNWEKTGIIKATGDPNPGTGHPKQYSPDTVLRAVLLQTLIDTFGSSAISLSELTNEVGTLIGKSSRLLESELLVLTRPSGAPRFTIRSVKPGQLRNYISGSSVDVHVVIDVKRLFDRIHHDWRNKFEANFALSAAIKQREAAGIKLAKKPES